jgi:Tol biopolymer transport system component
MEFSPNGRWFVTTTPTSPDVNNGQATLFLHDVERNQTRTFMLQADYSPISMLYDWSVDGRWLAISAEDNVLDLVAPDFDYQRFLPHDFGVCTSIAWISP